MPLRTIQGLIEGFRVFRETYYEENRPLFDALVAQGQMPKVMMIGCSDSRVDPLLITSADPGDVFVVRNVANLVPPYDPDGRYHGTSAALEFAVRVLAVEHIVVLGHAQCGGVQALLEGSPLAGTSDDFLGAWMRIAWQARLRAEALAPAGPERQRACEHETVKVSLANLATFPWIGERIEARRLTLHGWHFELAGARLTRLDRAEGRFMDV